MADIIVIGGGHAGVEAALACARLKKDTILYTMHIDMIASMPCNPSIGGPAKGIVVREIDALGGESEGPMYSHAAVPEYKCHRNLSCGCWW